MDSTHHSLWVYQEKVLLGVVLHPSEDILTNSTLALSHKEVSILQGAPGIYIMMDIGLFITSFEEYIYFSQTIQV